MPSIQARALRDMAAPGTAYDDPELGADPQVGHMDDYVETTADNGGVHLNSGIPNKAFQLAAVAIGGSAIEGAGRIWYDALVGGDVPEDADFAAFAAATVAAAGQHADAVREAWAQVGVEPADRGARAGAAAGPAPGGCGWSAAAASSAGPRRPRSTSTTTCAAWSPTPALGSLAARATRRPMPDMYVYTFTVDDQRSGPGARAPADGEPGRARAADHRRPPTSEPRAVRAVRPPCGWPQRTAAGQ